jgi:hypothetical protein
MGDSWNTRTPSFADLNPIRNFKDFRNKNTSCIGHYQPSSAPKVFETVSIDDLYKTAYGHYPRFKLETFSEHEKESGVNPHPAASWRAKFEYMLAIWEKQNAQLTKATAQIQAYTAESAKAIDLIKTKNAESAKAIDLIKIKNAELAAAKEQIQTHATESARAIDLIKTISDAITNKDEQIETLKRELAATRQATEEDPTKP